jgi:ATP-binding cassette subfamily F protein 3
VQIGYYAQTHEGLQMRSTLVDEIRQISHLSEEGARSYLGRFLFTGDDVFKSIGSLSGGERSRVALAKLTLEGANFLVLDEPTNHLDLPARQVLEEILAQYDGTMIFVSHDRYFVDALATKLWLVEDGAVRVFDGNYTRYRIRQARLESAAGIPTPERKSAAGKLAGIREGSGDRDRIGLGSERGGARSVGQVESEITALEGRISELEKLLAEASAETNVGRISELALEYQEVNACLDSLYQEWQELAG